MRSLKTCKPCHVARADVAGRHFAVRTFLCHLFNAYVFLWQAVGGGRRRWRGTHIHLRAIFTRRIASSLFSEHRV